MASVNIGIGHDHDLVVSQLRQVDSLRVFLSTDGHAKGGVDIADFLALESPVLHGFLDVENLTPQRKDGLEGTVTTNFGSSAGGIALNEEELALGRILVGAVGKLAGKAAAAHDGLALHKLTGLACSVTGCGSQNHLLHYQFGILGILLEISLERCRSSCRHSSHHLAVAELGLGLALELRLSHFH